MSLVQLALTQAAQLFLHVLHVAQATTKARQEHLLASLVLPARISLLQDKLRAHFVIQATSAAPRLFSHVHSAVLVTTKVQVGRLLASLVLLALINPSQAKPRAHLVVLAITKALQARIRVSPVLLEPISHLRVRLHAVLAQSGILLVPQLSLHARLAVLVIIKVPLVK